MMISPSTMAKDCVAALKGQSNCVCLFVTFLIREMSIMGLAPTELGTARLGDVTRAHVSCDRASLQGLTQSDLDPPMPSPARFPVTLSKNASRLIWLRAQRLDELEPFGGGPNATRAAIEHLGYLQIDTIHVIERCHHHILWNRIPDYRREHLHQAQTVDKSVFEGFVTARELAAFTERG